MEYNLAQIFRIVANVVPDRRAIVSRYGQFSFAQVAERSTRLANLLLASGITLHTERKRLEGWQSGQDHVALCLYNGHEYLEGFFGAAIARAASFNVNYRYTESEFVRLLNDANAAAIVYQTAFSNVLGRVIDRLHRKPLLLQVADESGGELLDGARDYEQALSNSSSEPPNFELSPDDLYILYTGGTTGQPKGCLWRQADIFDTTLSQLVQSAGIDTSTFPSFAAGVKASEERRSLPAAPLMHGAGQWIALGTLLGGGTVVFPDVVERLDAAALLEAIERERVQLLAIVGDAFAHPICEELRIRTRNLSSLLLIVSGGATMSVGAKTRLLDLIPSAVLVDTEGASETGPQLSNVSSVGVDPTSGFFMPNSYTFVVNDHRTRLLGPGETEIGWLAHGGPVPLGYLGDRVKSDETFVTIEGRRMAVPGDRARIHADGLVELLGRESTTINSGGEKIFAEEVEQALMAHPEVIDALVVGRHSQRWGQEVVAVVQLTANSMLSDAELSQTAIDRIARYKAPKAFVRVDQVKRTVTGKPDYSWAREIVGTMGHNSSSMAKE